MNLTESDALQNADQEIVMKSKWCCSLGVDKRPEWILIFLLKIPLQHVKQRTSLEIDVCKQTTVCPEYERGKDRV